MKIPRVPSLLLSLILWIGATHILPGIAFSAEEAKGGMKYINFNPNDEEYYFLYPIAYYLNTAFDCAQVPAAFPQNHYFRNHEKVFNRVYNPVKGINENGGWGVFFRDEVATERAIPNYTLHLMGNGYDCRTLWEWYHYNGFPFPYLLAFITTYLAHFGNEAIEYNNHYLTSHDHIADLYIFDLVGNLMFLNDDVASFFHDTLQMRNWMGQPVYRISDGLIKNAFTNYIFRPYIFGEQVRPFISFGMSSLAGLSIKISRNDYLTLSGGIAAVEPFNADSDSFDDYMKKIRGMGAIFWDREDKLLWALMINGTEEYLIRLNVYPQLFNIKYFNIGFYTALTDNYHFVFGISMYKVFGLGAAL